MAGNTPGAMWIERDVREGQGHTRSARVVQFIGRKPAAASEGGSR